MRSSLTISSSIVAFSASVSAAYALENATLAVQDTASPNSALEDDVASSSTGCARHIAYSAPASCPTAKALQNHLGPAYQVHSAQDECALCTVAITIRREDAEDDSMLMPYELELSGLEATPARRRVCHEVVALALHTVEASDHRAPCAPADRPRSSLLPLEVGTSVTPSIRLASQAAHTTLGVKATWLVGNVRTSANLLWIPPTQLASELDGSTFDALSLSGYGAGIDACWMTRSWLHLCGVGLWRQFNVSPTGGSWSNVEPSHVLTGGGSIAVRWQAQSGVGVELQPALLFSPFQGTTRDHDTGSVLHEHSGLEIQLRMSVAWALYVPTHQ